MMWIDGEFFNDPVEELKSKKAVDVILKYMEVVQKQVEFYAIMHEPFIPHKGGGQVLQVNSGKEKEQNIVMPKCCIIDKI